MIFAATLVAFYIGAFALGAIDNSLADAVLPIMQCALTVVALCVPAVRRALLDTLTRYWPAALAFVILLIITMRQGGMLDAPAMSGGREARADVWRLIGFGMGALGMAGVALSTGRRQTQNVLLVGAIALGALAIAQHLQAGRSLFLAPDESAVVFSLFAALAASSGIDAMGSRAPRTTERRQTRAERLFLPAAAFGSALIGLALTGSLVIGGAFVIGLGALALGLALRERRRGAGLILLGALAALCLIGGGVLVFLARRAGGGDWVDAEWMTQSRMFMLAAAALAWSALLIRLGVSLDRRKRPSRGFALALAGLMTVVLAGQSGAAPASLATLALLIGIAAAHADYLAPVSPELRSSGQP